jgi:hypothetical protein
MQLDCLLLAEPAAGGARVLMHSMGWRSSEVDASRGGGMSDGRAFPARRVCLLQDW